MNEFPVGVRLQKCYAYNPYFFALAPDNLTIEFHDETPGCMLFLGQEVLTRSARNQDKLNKWSLLSQIVWNYQNEGIVNQVARMIWSKWETVCKCCVVMGSISKCNNWEKWSSRGGYQKITAEVQYLEATRKK